MSNFWKKLNKPFTVLAPMDDVTDVVFREVVSKVARPDVFFTEFVSVDAVNSKGAEKQLRKFDFTINQRPIVAQIWGNNPENFYKTAKLLKKLGFDGIDINMGCPISKVIKRGSCSALINNHPLALEIINATKKGANGLPVSVKTRLGVKEIQTEKWFTFLLSQNLDAITIHGRTVAEMSKVPAHWDEIGKIVAFRDEFKKDTVIIGNGDVKSHMEVLEKTDLYKVDGVMIGRGVFQNLFVFEKRPSQKNIQEMIKLLLAHAKLFDKVWGEEKNFAILRKFFKVYVSGFPGASNLRIKLMQVSNLKETEDTIHEFFHK